MKNKTLLMAVAALTLVALIGSAVFFMSGGENASDDGAVWENVPEELFGILLPGPKPLKPFALKDADGRLFDRDRMRGKWSLIFFGYTHCPDVCPVSMGVLTEVYDILQTDTLIGRELQVIFVSVDPQRDTNPILKEYVSYFNPGFVGVSGSKPQIDILAKQVGAGYFIDPPKEGEEGYTVSHSSGIFMVDPRARLVALFQGEQYPRKIAFEITKIRELIAGEES
ncbi:MAG: SCO family protein [Magnetococcales bacterium]|nr:SCO family protein [Magnetococcales bacterium]